MSKKTETTPKSTKLPEFSFFTGGGLESPNIFLEMRRFQQQKKVQEEQEHSKNQKPK